MRLVSPDIAFEKAFLRMAEDFQKAGDIERPWPDNWKKSPFGEYCEFLEAWGRGEDLPKGYVPMSTWYLEEKGELLGISRLRHRLEGVLLTRGGHIGYEIAPSKRGQGYGKALLKLTLLKCGELKLPKVLVTCEEGNLASAKVIESNGGKYEGPYKDPETSKVFKRYWIDLS